MSGPDSEAAAAKENAQAMPGGDRRIEGQDDIIEMLEKRKKRKMHVILVVDVSLASIADEIVLRAGRSCANSLTTSRRAYTHLRLPRRRWK